MAKKFGLARILTALRASPRIAGGQQAEDNAMLNDLFREHKANDAKTPERQPQGRDKMACFLDEFEQMVCDPPAGTVCMRITPEMAHALLSEYNDRNRPMSKTTLYGYARQMKENKWVYTREPIIFSDRGRLIDGQHRLAACAQSGISFDVDVAFNAPDKAFKFINIGKNRSGSDIFAINGVPNAKTAAAATKWVARYYEMGGVGRGIAGVRFTPDELYQVYLKHTGIKNSVRYGYMMAKSGLASSAVMCAMHYICAQRSESDADIFFTTVADGIGFTGKLDPRYKLHHYLQAERSIQRTEDKKTNYQIAAYTIKAWNKWRSGETINQFKIQDTERFPRAK